MQLILDASVTVAWLVQRGNPADVELANKALREIQAQEAIVPALWFPEVTNGILMAERIGGIDSLQSARFLGLVDTLPIIEDRTSSSFIQTKALTLARSYGLTGYDATYLELVLRTGRTLATFDRQLADAVRKAGGCVFGDGLTSKKKATRFRPETPVTPPRSADRARPSRRRGSARYVQPG